MESGGLLVWHQENVSDMGISGFTGDVGARMGSYKDRYG